MGKLMLSEFITVEDGLLSFAGPVVSALHYPCGTARVITGEPLPAIQTALLRYFRKHPGRTLSRDELAEQVWKQRYFYGSRAIDQTISKLRKKLRPAEGRIVSIYAEGYRFEAKSEATPEKDKAFHQRR